MKFKDTPPGSRITLARETITSNTYIKIDAGYELFLRYSDRDDLINVISSNGVPGWIEPEEEIKIAP